jgi:hypothetical protein
VTVSVKLFPHQYYGGVRGKSHALTRWVVQGGALVVLGLVVVFLVVPQMRSAVG